MGHSVKLNSKGMSLIEVLIAMLILMIVSMALMQTSLLGFQENLRNSLREEAVRIADQQIGDLRTKAFTQTWTDPALNSAGTPTTTTVTRNLRSFQKGFTVQTTITDIPPVSPTSKQITVAVTWTYKGSNFNHSTTIILGRK